ncbi:unnamed protein product [Rhodiola kirilowii]
MQQLKGTVQQSSSAVQQLSGSVQQLSTTMHQNQENVNDVTLRSGKKLAVEPMEQEEDEAPKLPEEERDAAKESEGAAEEHRPCPIPAASPIPATKEAKECPVPRTETPKMSAALPFPVPAEYQNNMSWMRTCSNCSAKSKSTSPS